MKVNTPFRSLTFLEKSPIIQVIAQAVKKLLILSTVLKKSCALRKTQVYLC